MQATASNQLDRKPGSRRHRGRRRLIGLQLGFCVLAGLLMVRPARVASAVQTDGEVEDVIIARSLRISRNTGANITAGCTASITGFTAIIEDIFEMYSVNLSNQGIVIDDAWYKTGDLHVCLAPTAPGSTVLNFWTDGTLTGVSFHAIGTCTERFSNFPETGLRMFSCYQDLKNLSGGYIGGTLTTNTISSLQLIGEESNPPGYTQASIATVRLWKPRSAGACTVSTGITCSLCETCTPMGGCVIGPRAGCKVPMQPGKAQLQLKDAVRDAADQVKLKWTTGPTTTFPELGSPLTTDDYALCIFDATGARLLKMTAPAGGTCGTKPCWKQLGGAAAPKGYAYKDRDGLPDDLDGLNLKAGEAGKASVSVKGKGENIPLPALGALALPLRAQLQSENGQCYEGTFSTPSVNTPTQFKAKSD